MANVTFGGSASGAVVSKSNTGVYGLVIQKATTDRTDKRLLASWHFKADHLDHYDVTWYIWSGVKWEKQNTKSVKGPSNSSKTVTDSFTPGTGVLYSKVKVKPVSTQYTYKKKKYNYWTASAETSQKFATPSWAPEKVNAPMPSVRQSGNTGRELIAEWSWNKAKTTSYNVQWYHKTSASGPWHEPTNQTATVTNAVYTAADNDYAVQVRVQPVTSSGDWVADYSGYAVFYCSNFAPDVPPTPTVTLKQYTLEAHVNVSNTTATQIVFEVIQDNRTSRGQYPIAITRDYAGLSIAVPAGHSYKVRCLGKNSVRSSYAWSDYSDNVYAAPPTPGNFSSYKALTSTSVELIWPGSSYADSYTIQYTNHREYFDASPDNVQELSVTSGTRAIVTGLDDDQGDNTWFFRCKATKDNSDSGWNNIVSVTVGRKPTAPTTWSLTSSVAIGDVIKLYWVHNTRDNSKQREAKIELIINGESRIETLTYDPSGEEDETTYEYDIDSSEMTDDTEIKWRVMTKGLSPDYSEWSTLRSVKAYEPATIVFDYESEEGFPEIITWLPIDISCEAGPLNREALRYVITIAPQQDYEIMEIDGSTRYVRANEEIYSEVIYPDISDSNHFFKSLGAADNISLADDVEYLLKCTVIMNTGLSASCTAYFTVDWEEIDMRPNAEIGIDDTNYAVYLRPYCLNEEGETLTDILLSVYRKNVDGTLSEISLNLDAESNLTVIDPHPTFVEVQYRIAARSKVTGQMVYTDLLLAAFDTSAIVIQWDETWLAYEEVDEDVDEDETRWIGSMVQLPYNVDVSDNKSPDVEFVEYIGREHPVSYYGTQKGETATWNTVIDAEDMDTLNALRRLAVWMGDCYVREPSGTGYWAQVNVSIAQKHRDVTIPITLGITRVEGGA